MYNDNWSDRLTTIVLIIGFWWEKKTIKLIKYVLKCSIYQRRPLIDKIRNTHTSTVTNSRRNSFDPKASEWLLLSEYRAIVLVIAWQEQATFGEMMMMVIMIYMSALY